MGGGTCRTIRHFPIHVNVLLLLLLTLVADASKLDAFTKEEKDKEEYQVNVVRVDVELHGVLKSTFKGNVQQLFEAGFSHVIGINQKKIRLLKCVEWDLSVVAEYRITVIGQLHLREMVKKITADGFAGIVAKRIKLVNPNMMSRFNDIFLKAHFSEPQIVKSYWDDDRLDLDQFYGLMLLAGAAMLCFCKKYRHSSARVAQYELLGNAKRNRSLVDCEEEV